MWSENQFFPSNCMASRTLFRSYPLACIRDFSQPPSSSNPIARILAMATSRGSLESASSADVPEAPVSWGSSVFSSTKTNSSGVWTSCKENNQVSISDGVAISWLSRFQVTDFSLIYILAQLFKMQIKQSLTRGAQILFLVLHVLPWLLLTLLLKNTQLILVLY